MFKLSKYLEIHPLPNDEPKSLFYSTKTGEISLMSSHLINYIESKEWENITTTELLELTRCEILVCEDENELETILSFDSYSEDYKEALGVTIQPTANCQLGCHYCGQSHSKNKMTDLVVQKTLERIKHILISQKYEKLNITWYGGEPLLALSLIESFYSDIFNFCIDNNIKYNSDIITNGLLLKPEYFEKLMKSNVSSIQVTIDGPKETHDKRRITKGGKGTFDVIMNNLKSIVHSNIFEEYKPSILLRINIDSTNYEEVPKLIELFKSENIFEKINIHFAPIVEWGDNKADHTSLTKEQFAEKEIDWFIELYQNGKTTSELIPGRKTYSCMVDDKNSEAYDAFGNIFPCYEYPYTAIYQNDDCIEGRVLDDVKFEDKKLAKIRSFKENLHKREYSYCIDCKFLPVCHGSCPKVWMQGGNACPTFKYNIKDRMLLHYLTLKNT